MGRPVKTLTVEELTKSLDDEDPSVTVETEDEGKKDRKFLVLLYLETDDYDTNKVMEKICNFPTYMFICHDKDTKADGTPDKSHYHCVIQTEIPLFASTVANKLGIDARWVRRCKNIRSAYKYLVHQTKDSFEKNKFRYSTDEVRGNDLDLFKQVIGEKHEGTVLRSVFADLDNGLDPFEILKASFDDGYAYSCIRRNWGIIKDYSHRLKETTYYVQNAELQKLEQWLISTKQYIAENPNTAMRNIAQDRLDRLRSGVEDKFTD